MDVWFTFSSFDIRIAKMDNLKSVNLAPRCKLHFQGSQCQYSSDSAPSLKYWQYLMKGVNGKQKFHVFSSNLEFWTKMENMRFLSQIQKSIPQYQKDAKYWGSQSFTISTALAMVTLAVSQLKMPLSSVVIPSPRTPCVFTSYQLSQNVHLCRNANC